MNGATDLPDIVRSFAHAGSFWRETVPLFAASLALLGAALALLVFRWRRPGGAARLRSLAAGEAGAAEAMDFVLTFPIVMLVAFLFVQLLMGAHASLVVHYAAYSAARAARTGYFDLTLDQIKAMQAQSLVVGNPYVQISLGDGGDARRRADTTARLALISAVPSSVRYPSRVTGVGATVIGAAARYEFNTDALQKKTAYAFARNNARVDIGVTDAYQQVLLGAALNGFRDVRSIRVDAMPVWARVQFRYPLTMPGVARFFGQNGAYTMTAEVTLL